MSPETGEQLLLWTVRTSVTCYVIALWRWLFRPADQTRDRVYSACWFAAWLLCVAHMICAFHFRHHWNHDVAIEHTAKTTEDVVGLRWGGGLYINYVFLTLWGLSAVSSLWSVSTQSAIRLFGPAWWWIPTLGVTAAVIWRWTQIRRQMTTS